MPQLTRESDFEIQIGFSIPVALALSGSFFAYCFSNSRPFIVFVIFLKDVKMDYSYV